MAAAHVLALQRVSENCCEGANSCCSARPTLVDESSVVTGHLGVGQLFTVLCVSLSPSLSLSLFPIECLPCRGYSCFQRLHPTPVLSSSQACFQ